MIVGELGPPGRHALREICETSDVVKEDGHTYLIARVSWKTMDTIAVFVAGSEDLEPGGSPCADCLKAGLRRTGARSGRAIGTYPAPPRRRLYGRPKYSQDKLTQSGAH